LGSDDNFDDDDYNDDMKMTAREGDFDENDRIIMQELKREKRKSKMDNFEYQEDDDDDDEDKDLSKMNPYQRSQYERHMKVIKNLKKEQTPA
jgi:hypothetical protein